jgi:hypothetical protein
MEEDGFSKGTLRYMKQNAKSDKPFTLKAHVRKRLTNNLFTLFFFNILSYYN